ncbi:MAG: HaeII family restriction endonuclease [Victivallales bacterium]|jgi:type II restriction enzyme|nr:HaeII family restriction endonuclease [Victivallales bacterium]
MNKEQAKEALDKIIHKSRIHFYKPIQIAEILYHYRTEHKIQLDNLDTYRKTSKHWRDEVSLQLLGSVCTSSCKFQDNLFDDNAIPPKVLVELGKENERTNGAVEAYIYRLFGKKHSQLQDILNYCLTTTPCRFQVKDVIDYFWREAGLKRSLDKVYEIIVYALFVTIIDALELKITISMNSNKKGLLQEFSDFTKNVMQIDLSNPQAVQNARVFRVGVTNAADRGLDMYSNWGPAIQIKHLTLDEELASSIVDSVSADRIIIVCKNVEKKLLVSVLNQIGWKSRIQSIITEENLIDWYDKALRGKYSNSLGTSLVTVLAEEMQTEFPSISETTTSIDLRHYENISDDFWK